MSKEAAIFIFDVNPNMDRPFIGLNGESTGETCLEACKRFVKQKLSAHLIFPKQNEFALLAMSTQDTDNRLNDDVPGQYQHIKQLKTLMRANLDHLNVVNSLSTAQGTNRGDVVDAILVAMQMLHERVGKLKFTRRIWLFTDGSNPSESDREQLELIRNGLKRDNYKVNVVGANFTELDEDNAPILSQQEIQAQRTETQLKCEDVLQYLVDECEGSVMSLREAMQLLEPIHKEVKQVTKFRGPLQIGEIGIAVHTYGACTETKFPTLTKEVVVNNKRPRGEEDGGEGEYEAGGGAVKQQRTYWNQRAEAGREEIDAEDRVRGFHYGLELVPFTEDQLAATKPQHERCMMVLAFVPRDAVKRHHFMGNADCVIAPPNEVEAQNALSAFIHACDQSNKLPLVRYVKRANDRPTLCVLFPHISEEMECFWLQQIPFAEDIRDFNFPSIDTNAKFVPNESQRSAARDFINSMDLMPREDKEQLEPGTTWNPALQRFYDSVMQRSMDPQCELPLLDPLFTKAVQVDKALIEASAPSLESFKQHFPLERVQEKQQTKKRSWREFDAPVVDSDIAAINEQLNQPTGGSQSSNQELSLSSAVRTTITQITSVRPIEDFEAMLADRSNANNVDIAMKQMSAIIIQLIRESFGDALYDKARDCMMAMRQAAIKQGEAHAYNQFLINEIKGTAQRLKPKFYTWISANPSIRPISTEESPDSEFTPSEASSFFFMPSQPLSEESIAQSNAEADEFDEMD